MASFAAISRPDAWLSTMDKAERIYAAACAMLYACGLLAHSLPALRPLVSFSTDAFLWLINATLLWLAYRRHGDIRLAHWILATYLFTFAIEVIGTATGAIFGSYAYGSGMKLQLAGVPLVIALNWTALVLAANHIALYLTRSPWIAALLAGLLVAGYDWFIEPVAIRLNYWRWATGAEVPLQNYAAWFLIGFAASIPLQLRRVRFRHPLLLVYWIVQWAYFVAMRWLLA